MTDFGGLEDIVGRRVADGVFSPETLSLPQPNPSLCLSHVDCLQPVFHSNILAGFDI